VTFAKLVLEKAWRDNASHPPAKLHFASSAGRAGGACGWLPLPNACERTSFCVSVPAQAGCSSHSTHLFQGEIWEGEEGDVEMWGDDAAPCSALSWDLHPGYGETGEGPEAGRDGHSLQGEHIELCNLCGVVMVWLKDLGKVTLGIASPLPSLALSAAFWEITMTENVLPAPATEQHGKAEAFGCACRCIKLFFHCSIKKGWGRGR